jgi:hypothetical protein
VCEQGGPARCKIACAVASPIDAGTRPSPPFYHVTPPGIFFICHWTCLSMAYIFGVMGHCRILLPLTAVNINVW